MPDTNTTTSDADADANAINAIMANLNIADSSTDTCMSELRSISRTLLMVLPGDKHLRMVGKAKTDAIMATVAPIHKVEHQYHRINKTIAAIEYFNHLLQDNTRRHRDTLREWSKGALRPGATIATSLSTAKRIKKHLDAIIALRERDYRRVSHQLDHYLYLVANVDLWGWELCIDYDFYGANADVMGSY
ncbi:hypothetical protein ACHAPT_008336 [Fusarium lateritium]